MKTGLSSPTATAALSLPWLPMFLAVLWIIHPWFVALTCALIAAAATPRGLKYSTSSPVKLSRIRRVYSTLVVAAEKTQYLPLIVQPFRTFTSISQLFASKNQKSPESLDEKGTTCPAPC